MLGFVHVSEGDVELTPEGQASMSMPTSPSARRSSRQAALERVTLIRQIRRALESKSNHTLPDEFFHDTLDEHFSEEETVQQLETAINWGRYAGLFDYDAATRKFFIPEEEAVEEVEPVSRIPGHGRSPSVFSLNEAGRSFSTFWSLRSTGGFLRRSDDRALLAGPGDSGDRNLALALEPAAIRLLFAGAHDAGVLPQSGLRGRLWIRSRPTITGCSRSWSPSSTFCSRFRC